jgi:dihydrodipicolinate synthase/N-acetylneuraminate lyase
MGVWAAREHQPHGGIDEQMNMKTKGGRAVLTASDIKGLYGIIATPASEGAERWDAVDTVNLEETERLANKLMADGVSGLIVLGSTGECATVTEDEYKAFVDCFLSTVDGRVPTMVGATSMGTHQTVARLRFAQERGATGTLLGLPMWQPCTEEMALGFYGSISEAFPDLAIMVYANANAFRFDFPVEFWEKLVKRAPTVTSAKIDPFAGRQALVEATKGRINMMPIDGFAYALEAASPGSVTACWATAAGMGPQPSVALMDAILANDMDRAKMISEQMMEATKPFLPPHAFPVFASYNLQLERLRIAAAGYCDPGPIRPPCNVIPEDLATGARECGHLWAELVKQYEA